MTLQCSQHASVEGMEACTSPRQRTMDCSTDSASFLDEHGSMPSPARSHPPTHPPTLPAMEASSAFSGSASLTTASVYWWSVMFNPSCSIIVIISSSSSV